MSISRGGVPKLPVASGAVGPLGIEGDEHAHPQFHGGPRQALLFIAEEVIEELKVRGYPVFPGALGENVTMRGVDPREMRLGQQWRVGPEVVVELTKVRVPCNTIKVYGEGIGTEIYDKQVKSGDISSPRWGTSGMYASVLVPGTIRVGDQMILISEAA